MAIGMVKIGETRMIRTFLIYVGLLFFAAVPLAYSVYAQAQTEAKLPPLSKECQAPAVINPPERPLPNTLKALKERKVIKILTIGATASAGREEGNDFQSIIESTLEKTVPGLDVQIIDRGVSGELARDAARRMKPEVALTTPDLVLWQVGTNDASARIPVEDFREALVEGIRWLKEHDVDVVLVGLHYVIPLRKDEHYQSIRKALAQIADEEKVLLVKRYEAMEMIQHMREGAAPPNEFVLTEAGYSCMAEYVVRAIASGIFVKKHS
jgi:acyl-CoA thioesterase I